MIAGQGTRGSFHHAAAEQLGGLDIPYLACATFDDVFEAVETGQARHGIVAVENNKYGSINEVYEPLATSKNLWVRAECYVPVEHQLIVAPANAKLTPQDITMVFSQRPAFGQCNKWLRTHMPSAEQDNRDDTAESVEHINLHSDLPYAAIASARAAKLHGGVILAGPINDKKRNLTRFLLFGKNIVENPHANKTSIILETDHTPGALVPGLQLFKDAGINLSRIDSHPVIDDDEWEDPLHKAFYIDYEAGIQDKRSTKILQQMRLMGCTVKILGSYEAATLPRIARPQAR